MDQPTVIGALSEYELAATRLPDGAPALAFEGYRLFGVDFSVTLVFDTEGDGLERVFLSNLLASSPEKEVPWRWEIAYKIRAVLTEKYGTPTVLEDVHEVEGGCETLRAASAPPVRMCDRNDFTKIQLIWMFPSAIIEFKYSYVALFGHSMWDMMWLTYRINEEAGRL